MKKLVLIFAILAIIWKYTSKDENQPRANFLVVENITTNASERIQDNRHNNFKCDGRQYCSQMASYEEAKFFNQNCPDTKMDGDRDGIPCERQFGR